VLRVTVGVAYSLFAQSAGFLLQFWPITMSLIAITIYSFWSQICKSNRADVSRAGWAVVLAPSLVTITIILWAASMRWDAASATLPPLWPMYVVHGLLAIQLLWSVLLIRSSVGWRIAASSSLALQLWVSYVCSGVAGMALTGNWL